MDEHCEYLVEEGEYEALIDISKQDNLSADSAIYAFVKRGNDDVNMFCRFNNDICVHDVIIYAIDYGKFNILRYLVTQSIEKYYLWLTYAVRQPNRIIAKFIYEQPNQRLPENPPQWFTDFLASRESYRSLALLVLYATRGNIRDVGRMISRCVWALRGETAFGAQSE